MSDQKYRQRGYKDHDDDRERRDRQPSGPRPPRREGPRGRGLGQPKATVFRCAVCGRQQSPDIVPGSVCAQCDADLHTCTHCTSFDSSAPGQCRHPDAEYVASKAKRNECEHFQPRTTQEFAKEAESMSAGKAAFDALFKI